MNKYELLRQLGVYIETFFFTEAECLELINEATNNGIKSKAKLISTNGKEHINQEIRNNLTLLLTKPYKKKLKESLEALKPSLVSFFKEDLYQISIPNLLCYGAGHFFKPHNDKGSSSITQKRKLTVILFLNNQTQEAKEIGYVGGNLYLYGLFVNKPEVGLPLAESAGTLIAFRSELLHEVTKIISGQRYTLVTWFT